jgi:hypothetical protein
MDNGEHQIGPKGVHFRQVLAELQDQLNGVMTHGTRAQVAKVHSKLASHYYDGGFYDSAIEHLEKEIEILKELNGSTNTCAIIYAYTLSY